MRLEKALERLPPFDPGFCILVEIGAGLLIGGQKNQAGQVCVGDELVQQPEWQHHKLGYRGQLTTSTLQESAQQMTVTDMMSLVMTELKNPLSCALEKLLPRNSQLDERWLKYHAVTHPYLTADRI
jgi:hypothetical protein